MKFMHKLIRLSGLAVLLILTAAPAGAYTLDELMQLSVKNRESIKIRQGDIEKSRSNMTIARSMFIPKLEASYESERDIDKGSESSAFSVTSSLNLFAGFRDLNNFLAEKKSAEVSRLLLKSAKQDLQLDVAAGFTEVFRAIENLRVAKSSLKLFQERYENVKLKFETGLLTRRDTLAVKVEVDHAEQMTRIAEATVAKSLNRLSRITSVSGLTLETLDFKRLDTLPVKTAYDALEAKLLANRSELTIQQRIKEASFKRYKAKKSEFYPHLNLAAIYSKEDASYDPWDKHEDWTAQVSVSMNFFDGMKTAAGLKSRKQDISNARYALVELEKTLKIELKNILLDFDVAEKNLKAAASGIDEARENVRTTELAFSHGRSTTTDILNSIDSLIRAERNVINARMDLLLTDFRVKRMVEDFRY